MLQYKPNRKMQGITACFTLMLGISSTVAQIANGPGVPNLTYNQADVGKTLSLVKNREGHGTVAMHRGYMVVIFSKDGGLGQGAISFLNISDPRNPKVVHIRDDSVTHEIREPHGWGMRGDIACLQANYGLHFWDFSDVTNPRQLSYIRLPDIIISDYDKGMWWSTWQGGYVYGGGSGNGLYIVDAKDPSQPKFVKKISTSATGGFRVGPVHAVGNILVLTSTDKSGISVLDIGDPVNPKLLSTLNEAESYSSMLNGNKIALAGSGTANNGVLMVYDISDPTRIQSLGRSAGQGDKGGYVNFSDGYVFAGWSTKGFAKHDLSKPDFPVVSSGSSGLAGRDEDFAIPLGNLVFIPNDHPGQGSAIMAHQTGPDTKGPSVNMVSPRDRAVNQNLKSRVGVTFTDIVEGSTVNTANFTVRPLGGTPLEGWYAHQSGIVNFSPKEDLLPNTTYEIVIRKEGVKDYAGNGSPEEFRSFFSTGPTIQTVVAIDTSPNRAAGTQRNGLVFGRHPNLGFTASGRTVTWDAPEFFYRF